MDTCCPDKTPVKKTITMALTSEVKELFGFRVDITVIIERVTELSIQQHNDFN